MLFSEMRTRFAKFMGTEDTVQPAISDTDRDSLLNESAMEYIARFGNISFYTTDIAITSGSNNFSAGLSGDGQWVECLALERKSGSVYLPFTRGSFSSVMTVADGEGVQDIGVLGQFGLALVSRTIDGASVFKVVWAPRAVSGSLAARALVRRFPAPLVNGTDFLELDDNRVDHVVRIAALRAGPILGYDQEWFDGVALPLPEHIRREMEIDAYMRFSDTTEPRQVG